MTGSLTYHVAIAGAGPAGAFLALLLSRAGMKVLLLEASAGFRRKVCGEYLCPRGVSLLREAGLGAVTEPFPVLGMRLFSPSGIEVPALFPENLPGAAVPRDELDRLLCAEAGKAGAELRRSERLEGISRVRDGWELKTEHGMYRARFLVGADGRQSLVAKRLGVQAERPNSRRAALHFFARTDAPVSRCGEMHILAGGAYAGICPTGERELNVSVVCDADTLKQGARAALTELLKRSECLGGRFLPLPAATEVLAAFPLTHRVSHVAGPGWALVGDAAGFLDPLTGEGIYQALLSAKLLAGCLERPGREGIYRAEHARALRAKTRVNRAFQSLIRSPAACDWVGNRLRARPARADAFLGLVGNVHGPLVAIKQIIFS